MTAVATWAGNQRPDENSENINMIAKAAARYKEKLAHRK